MMRFVCEPCRPCFGARELPHVLLPADEPGVTLMLNSPIPYGAHKPSHQYQTATSASIEEGTAIVVPTSLKKAWREASNSHTPSGPPVGVDAFAQRPHQQIFILSIVEKRGFPFNFSWHHGMQICKYGWETGSEKPVAVIKLWGIRHKRYVIPT